MPLCAHRVKTIKALGATAVMLAPVAAHAPGLGLLGRAPVSYFAPDTRLAVGDAPGAAARELKQLVRALHEAGLEVILQVGLMACSYTGTFITWEMCGGSCSGHSCTNWSHLSPELGLAINKIVMRSLRICYRTPYFAPKQILLVKEGDARAERV